ncbi:hypothetical protein IID23_04340 [Patescibacteria group bacterium]|nr:hypothetical protein [Patescibacteria group bacterium]
MRTSEVEQHLNETPMGSKLMPIFTVIGLLIVFITWLIHINLSGTVAEYYSNPKLVRDAAESGSIVLGQLESIKTTSAWITPLTFVGLAFLLTAISASLTGIKKTLGLRSKVFEVAIPKIAKGK